MINCSPGCPGSKPKLCPGQPGTSRPQNLSQVASRPAYFHDEWQPQLSGLCYQSSAKKGLPHSLFRSEAKLFINHGITNNIYRTSCFQVWPCCFATEATPRSFTSHLVSTLGQNDQPAKQHQRSLPFICFQVDTLLCKPGNKKWSSPHVVAISSQIPCKRWDLELVHTTLSLPFRPCYLGCKVGANALTESQCS